MIRALLFCGPRLTSFELTVRMCWVLAFSTLAAFSQAIWLNFLNYDDHLYVFLNPRVTTGLSWENTVWAFTALHADVSYWHPLTWLSHQLDCELFGLRPGPHHLTFLIS